MNPFSIPSGRCTLTVIAFFFCLSLHTKLVAQISIQEFTFNEKAYRIKAEKVDLDDYKYKITLTRSDTVNAESFLLVTLKPDVFKVKFVEAMKLFSGVLKAHEANENILNEKANDLFVSIVTGSFNVSDAIPPSGYLTFEQPIIVAHDYNDSYGVFGWSKKKLLQNVIKNSLELYRVKDSLLCLYKKFYQNSRNAQLRGQYTALRDSITIKYKLQETKINRRLTHAQNSKLLRSGIKSDTIRRVFPYSAYGYNTDTICFCSPDSQWVQLEPKGKLAQLKSKGKWVKLNPKSKWPTPDTSKIDSFPTRKQNKYLASKIENIQHSIANMKGELRDIKLKVSYEADTIQKNALLKIKKEQLNLVRTDSITAYEYITSVQNSLIGDTLDYKKKLSDYDNVVARIDSVVNLLAAQTEGEISQANKDEQKKLLEQLINLKRLKDSAINASSVLKSGNTIEYAINKAKEKSLELQEQISKIKTARNSDMRELNKKKASLEDSIQKIKTILRLLPVIKNYKNKIDQATAELNKATEALAQAEKKSKEPSSPVGFKIASVQVEFSEGNLKNVMVIGTHSESAEKSDSLTFLNPYPIPFSAIRDFNYPAHLYSFNHRYPPDNYRYWIHLSDVFRYIPKFYTDAEDYSPADTAFLIKPNGQNVRILHKNPVDRLLDARIYTDLLGLDETTPNGLIQMEISKKIILRPNRDAVIIGRRPYYFGGIFSYIEPSFALTKIENKNKELNLDALYDTVAAFRQQAVFRSATSIDLLRYANFNFGFKLNLFVLDFPQTKSSFYVDAGTRLYRTSILDSTSTAKLNAGIPTGEFNSRVGRYNANSIMSFVELTWQIKPDHRFGLSISPRISYFDLKSLRFQQTEKRLEAEYFKTAADLDTGRPYWMFNLQLNAYILSSTNGRIFFRSNYVFMLSNMKQDFFQAQLGYAFNILRRRPGR